MTLCHVNAWTCELSRFNVSAIALLGLLTCGTLEMKHHNVFLDFGNSTSTNILTKRAFPEPFKDHAIQLRQTFSVKDEPHQSPSTLETCTL